MSSLTSNTKSTFDMLSKGLSNLNIADPVTFESLRSSEMSKIQQMDEEQKAMQSKKEKKYFAQYFGDYFVQNLEIEKKILSKVSRLPGLVQSNFGLDIVENRDEDIDLDDVFENQIAIGQEDFQSMIEELIG